LSGTLPKDARKFFPEIRHIGAQLHHCDNSLQVIVEFIAAKLFEPLMAVFEKSRIGIYLSQFLADIAINGSYTNSIIYRPRRRGRERAE
jgi:hypothetical protein